MTNFQHFISALRSHFSFSEIVLNGPIGGYSTLNIACEADGKRYFLKCYKEHSYTQACQTLKTFNYFSEKSIPVIPPLQGLNKETLFTASNNENTFHCLLFPWHAGITLDESTLTEQSRKVAASILASIHRLPLLSSLPHPDLTKKIKEAQAKIQLIIDRPSMVSLEKKEAVQQLLSLKKSVLKDYEESTVNDSPVILHGDYHNQNLLYEEEGKTAVILDLDDVRLGHRFLDVMSFLSLACWNTGFTDEHLRAAKQFLTPYLLEAGLSSECVSDGFHTYLYDWCGSFFMEEGVLSGRDELFPLVLRDIRKLTYYLQEKDTLLDALCP